METLSGYASRLLCDELASRKARNASYSLRAFARDLGVSVTCLSDVIGAKRQLSRMNAERVASRLGLSPEEAGRLIEDSDKLGETVLSAPRYLTLEDDTFRIIADWYYYAILNLARLKGCRADARWISRRLGISLVEAKAALDRLLRLKFVEDRSGKLVRSVKPLHFQAPSSAMTKHYRQNLRLAEHSLDHDPFEKRVFSSMTMAIDPELLDKATKKVNRFKHGLSELLETEKASEVYVLSVQLFPVSRKDKSS